MNSVAFNECFFRLTALILLTCSSAQATNAAESWTFEPNLQAPTRAETRIDVTGELKLLVTLGTDDGGKSRQKTTPVPVSVSAQLRYTDRALPHNDEIRGSLRLYELAEATLHVGKGEIKSQLADERTRIVIQESADRTDIFSPAGPLDRSELDLLLVPGDSGLLNHLLPSKAIKIGDTWQADEEVVAKLLRLDVINQTDFKLRLKKVEKNVAQIEMSGKVSGGADGVTSEVEITGKLNYDLASQCCTWLAMELKEDRAASQGAPGFETTSRIRVAVAPAELPPELTDEAIADLKTTPDEATRLLRFVSTKQGFELVYEPAWRVVSDQHDLAVLRLIDRGDLVAQCNLSKLKPLGEGEQLTLEAYQDDLKRSLGKTFVEFIEAGESLSDSGLRVLRVVVSAAVSEVPIHYVFIHLSDDHQNRLSIAFTMDSEMVERFGRSEDTLIGSLRFTKSSVENEQPPAQEAKKSSATMK